MAYVIATSTAFNIVGEGEGYNYSDSMNVIRSIAESCLGRFYIDEEGNAIYESRYALLTE